MKPILSIVIPTFNNPQFLNPCIASIMKTSVVDNGIAEIIVVNNGDQPIQEFPGLRVIKTGKNLGWEGGLKAGLEASDAPFVCFQNDDTFIPIVSQALFYPRLLSNFRDPSIGAVGPSTTTAAGLQSIYHPNMPVTFSELRWMIFFCVIVRRSALDAVGGIDTNLPGGDDFDLSIRLRRGGYKLVFDPGAFIVHHGFKTGERVRGTSNVSGGWNSKEMSEDTNRALIQKHGFKEFFTSISQQLITYCNQSTAPDDIEGGIIRSLVSPENKVLELGCGFRKTVEQSVGIDRVPKGEQIPLLPYSNERSVADMVADVSKPLPVLDASFDVVIARHILEHIIDPMDAIRNWIKPLKEGGKLIIAAPDEEVCAGIPLSFDHLHAFTMSSLKSIAESLGLVQVSAQATGNGISFVSCFEKSVPASCPSAWVSTTGEDVTCSD